MAEFILAIIIGIVCIVIGVFNINGHIGTLKRKHRKRVSEEDLPVFSKWIGIGTIIMGVGVLLMGALSLAGELASVTALATVGIVALIAGLVIGGVISVYAMIKYNKGIF